MSLPFEKHKLPCERSWTVCNAWVQNFLLQKSCDSDFSPPKNPVMKRRDSSQVSSHFNMLTSLWHFTSALYKFLAVWIFKLKNHFSQHHIRIRGACRTLVCFKLWIFCWYNTFSVIGVSNSPWKLLISRQLHLAKSEFGIGKKTGVVLRYSFAG